MIKTDFLPTFTSTTCPQCGGGVTEAVEYAGHMRVVLLDPVAPPTERLFQKVTLDNNRISYTGERGTYAPAEYAAWFVAPAELYREHRCV